MKDSLSLELGMELLWQMHILWWETKIVITKNLTWIAKRSRMIPVIIVKRWKKLVYPSIFWIQQFCRESGFFIVSHSKRTGKCSPPLCNVERIKIYRRESLFFDWTLNIYIPFELTVMPLAEKLCKSEGVHWIINQGIHPAKYIRALWSRWKNTFVIWKGALVPDWC